MVKTRLPAVRPREVKKGRLMSASRRARPMQAATKAAKRTPAQAMADRSRREAGVGNWRPSAMIASADTRKSAVAAGPEETKNVDGSSALLTAKPAPKLTQKTARAVVAAERGLSDATKKPRAIIVRPLAASMAKPRVRSGNVASMQRHGKKLRVLGPGDLA